MYGAETVPVKSTPNIL